MSIFGDIFSKLKSAGQALNIPVIVAQAEAAPAAPPVVVAASPAPASPATAAPAPSPAAPAETVDAGAIMDALAKANPEHLDWKKSIVDMLKLLGHDSSLTARKALAAELHYKGDTSDSATMNIWLHAQVMQNLKENGGKLPAGL